VSPGRRRRGSRGTPSATPRNLLVLDVETRGGIVGMGYLFSFRPGLRTVAMALEETILPRVIGKDATAVEGIWNDLWRATATYNRGGIVTMAMSALDIALWDAIGKRAGLPLHRLWGHVRSQIPVYGSGCFRGSGGDGMIAKALHYKAQGYRAIKMQVAHTDNLRGDVDNVRRMREGARPRHRHHDRRQSGLGRRCRDSDGPQVRALRYLLAGGAGSGRRLRGIPARGASTADPHRRRETHFTRFDLRPFFENPCIPILQPDPMRGGFTDLRKIAVVADTWGMTIAPHLFPELNVQLVACDPERHLDRGHGLVERSVRRSGAGDRRHDHRAGTAGPRARVQAGDIARMQSPGRAGLCRRLTRQVAVERTSPTRERSTASQRVRRQAARQSRSMIWP